MALRWTPRDSSTKLRAVPAKLDSSYWKYRIGFKNEVPKNTILILKAHPRTHASFNLMKSYPLVH